MNTPDSPSRLFKLLREARRLTISDSFALEHGNLELLERNQLRKAAVIRTLQDLKQSSPEQFEGSPEQALLSELRSTQRHNEETLSLKMSENRQQLQMAERTLRRLHSVQDGYHTSTGSDRRYLASA
ncbi:MAG: hypothetical protein ACOCVG_02790 [Verrucomicrobiota bacterium]